MQLDGLPHGTHDLDPEIVFRQGPPKQVRCYVAGCRRFLRPPARGFPGDPCPEHGIRCHHSSAGGTYSYADVRRNAIVSPNLLATRLVGHPFKYESHRLGSERSEDAVTWNVFRSLQEAGCLHRLGQLITGDTSGLEPFLYLWGICLTEDLFDPWSLLIQTRRKFESDLPVDRPLTEPDIALHLPGRYLILIEAKFTSPNTYYERGPRKDASSLTLDELVTIYNDPALRILDCRKARSACRVYYQLWRNMVFSEWMAGIDHPVTRAFHVNLVRSGTETQSAAEFSGLVVPGFKERFQRLTWERIYAICSWEASLSRLRTYMETKTAGLLPAFSLGEATRNSRAATKRAF